MLQVISTLPELVSGFRSPRPGPAPSAPPAFLPPTLPPRRYVHVGLITFGRHVHVYELGFTECSKCYVFRGSKVGFRVPAQHTKVRMWSYIGVTQCNSNGATLIMSPPVASQPY